MKKILHSIILILVISHFFAGCGTSVPYSATEETMQKIETCVTDEKVESTFKEEIKESEDLKSSHNSSFNSHIVVEKYEITSEPDNKENVNYETERYCRLYVRCDTILNNMDKLKEEKAELIPENGVIYENDFLKFEENETVFELLKKELKSSKIHFEFTKTPAFNSMYIEGIANIYAFDAGELSGWMYKVNDNIPNYSCSEYIINNRDKIEFLYTCDSGRDIR